MFAGSTAGELSPPYVYYNSGCMWTTWRENGPSGCRYNPNTSGWFDAATFSDWFEIFMLPTLNKLSGKKVIICDLSFHISLHALGLCEQSNIVVICLPPHSTHLTQPLDVSVFWFVKGEGGNSWRVEGQCETQFQFE
jgi:hypothetical protein